MNDKTNLLNSTSPMDQLSSESGLKPNISIPNDSLLKTKEADTQSVQAKVKGHEDSKTKHPRK